MIYPSIYILSGNLLASQDDSSSEEIQTGFRPPTNGKPAVPPRPRSISAVEYKRNGLPPCSTLAGNNGNARNVRACSFTEDEPCKDNDVANADCKSKLLLY